MESHKHLAIGKLYAHKDDHRKIWKFVGIDAQAGTFRHQPLFGSPEEAVVKLSDLKDWKVCSLKEPELVDDGKLDNMMPLKSQQLDRLLAKAQCQVGLYEFYQKQGEPNVAISNTGSLYARKPMKKGNLKLAPFGSVQICDGSKMAKNACVLQVQGSTETFVVSPPKADFKKGSGVFVPFHLLKHADDGDDAAGNMEKVQMKYEKMTIPVYKNKRNIDEGTELLLEPLRAAPKKSKVKK